LLFQLFLLEGLLLVELLHFELLLLPALCLGLAIFKNFLRFRFLFGDALGEQARLGIALVARRIGNTFAGFT